MCNGPLLGKILRFALPLMLSGVLQLLFNAADIVVVGQYAGQQALAAVGSTSSLINLLINVFIGLSVGACVQVARFFGAKSDRDISETVHTAIALSLVCGVFLVFFGFFLSKPLLSLMGTPDDVLDMATLYMRIYFAGMPVIMLYNFGSAVLRAVGDTKRPLYFLVMAGVVNVLLNLFFVIVCGMDVDGVALATVLAQCISAGLIVYTLMRTEGSYQLYLKKLKIHKTKFLGILRTGLPAGVQGALFSISNVLIQSSINSFGSVVMAGSTAAANIEGFIYTAMNSFHHAALSFTSQNMGAKKYDRMGRALGICLVSVAILGLVAGNSAVLAGNFLIGIYSPEADVISYGVLRLRHVVPLYCICGMMDTMVGAIRGMGFSVMPMIVSTIGACGLRILWIYTIFAAYPTLEVLFLSYPVSWTATTLVHIACYLYVRKKVLPARLAAEE
ncbi:MATE family efflux transporter [Hominifimenecus sp. rT4P-3]|uniref:MATE family efflux transporter n=1 Tax=Hominifimenecus sp. rT4P-3 TaxID=3242979 RepID=UPI003DA33693